MNSLIVVFVGFVMVWLICIMFPMREEHKYIRHNNKPVRNTNIKWENCQKCLRLFPKKELKKFRENEYLCKQCYGLVKIYMDNE